jgi:GNAT superfamily N-acetyltransferase
MKTRENYVIREMTLKEVENIAIQWAENEGWNPGLYDALCYYKTDPNGFFVGLLDGIPISCISAISYSENYGFIGFYIVKPEYRGKGYGITIWNAALNYLSNKNIGLDGVIEQQDNYIKSGFELAYSNIRFEGIAEQVLEKFSHIKLLSEVQFNDLIAYDSKFFPVPRPAFLKEWINQPESLGLAAISNNELKGYSVLRKCNIGYKIGPLFADDKFIAEKLFISSLNYLSPGTKFYFDTPEINQNAIGLAHKYEMEKVFSTARMYTDSQPQIDLNKVFGVTTFELG